MARRKGTLFGKPRSKVVKHPGSFKRAAEAHHEGTAEFARHVLKKGSKASLKMKRKASLAKGFATMRREKGAKKTHRRTRKG